VEEIARRYTIDSKGIIRWKVRFKKSRVGDKVGQTMRSRYLSVSIDGITFQAHRVAWVLYTGEDPGLSNIDHRNGDKTDNRRPNLRLTSIRGNQCSFLTKRKSASSKYRGVSWQKSKSKWRAYIKLPDELRYLGSFGSEVAAAFAYDRAARDAGFFPEALNFPQAENHQLQFDLAV